jgi:GxxExxY protein
MFEHEGYQFMGAAFEVYNELGYGMAEEVYQQSLEIELSLRGISFQSKRELQVFYKDNQLDTVYKPDLLVWSAIVVQAQSIELVSDRTIH